MTNGFVSNQLWFYHNAPALQKSKGRSQLTRLLLHIAFPCHRQHHHFSKAVWNVRNFQQPPHANSLQGFYIWLSHQGAPIAVFDTGGALLWGNGGEKNQKTKTGVYFCRATTLCSLADVRSWIYKTKAVSALPWHAAALCWQIDEK